MTDPDTRAAIDALTRRLRDRDPDTDDEVFALEFITALRARGWRPTEAKAIPAWKPRGAPSGGLPVSPEVIALVRGTHASLDAKAAARREAGDGAA
jgi:hypothetical protein